MWEMAWIRLACSLSIISLSTANLSASSSSYPLALQMVLPCLATIESMMTLCSKAFPISNQQVHGSYSLSPFFSKVESQS
ncbi:hypothetical protein BDD12DRAFT_867194 [Trichophaea hybrida]|nr:hypothetical protein BDD12DRAFT_867194 [Trichophaea hybrida]